MSEKDKATNISSLMAKAKKAGQKKKPPVKVIKAGGANKGSGRPRGVKGKYKMVDPRLKKDKLANCLGSHDFQFANAPSGSFAPR